jgi:hypothetical protein
MKNGMTEEEMRRELTAKWARKNKHPKMPATELSPEQPAPKLAAVVTNRGPELATLAIEAWQKRLDGVPIVTVAHEMGVSIEGAKQLIREAHEAIAEDLKTALNQNRELDLQRTDMILKAFLPAAREGDRDSAAIVLKALTHRARLTGTEPQAQPGHSKPENVLIWIQQQLPAINKIVDALPIELER